MRPTYRIRPFLPDEIADYKRMRFEALRLEPGMFGNPQAKEEALPEAEWAERVLSPDRGTFGLYANEVLVGITSVIRDKEKRGEAYMMQSYIRREHRGKGPARRRGRGHGVLSPRNNE